MGVRFPRRILGFVLLLAGFPLLSHADQRNGRKYTPPPATCTIKVTVIRSTNGKAIPNAAVVFHPMEGDKDKGALELKSDEDGKVTIDVIPIGDTVRLQVIADGWQTYGEDYKIDTDSKEILVKMKRPTAQYSLYGDGTRDCTQLRRPQRASRTAPNPPSKRPYRNRPGFPASLHWKEPRVRLSVKKGA